jgi:hypothetical protein
MYSSYGKERKMLLQLTEADAYSKASKHGKDPVYGIVFQLLIEMKLSQKNNLKRCDIVE